MNDRDTTDMTLFVRTSGEDITGWQRQKIVDALIRETNVDIDTAQEISRDVERQIIGSGIEHLTAPLIRELVDAKLMERGLEGATRMHARIGFPLYDVGQLLSYRNKENANVPHSPEGTNLTLAEGIKREYAILTVFSDDVGYAHMTGDIHIHNLGYIDRPYCACQSLEYIKKFGVNLPNSLAVTAPAKHAEVLLIHMIRFAAALQGNFAGAVGWYGVNLFFAPYLDGLSSREVTQLSQMLIYEFSQQAVGRGGQTMFTDMHLYWEVPHHLEAVPAIGPGGQYTGKTYGAYAAEAQRFVRAIFEVYREGDAAGRPFVFPRPLVHITDKFFQTPGHEEFLHLICDVAAEKGNTHFVFDRGQQVNISECCRLDCSTDGGEGANIAHPENMRYFALQNVSINLPRLGYRADGDDETLFSLITEALTLAAKAHSEKKAFIEGLMSLGTEGPLSLLTMEKDGSPYLQMSRVKYLTGMVGLNELVEIHRGSQLHEDTAARTFALQVITHMKDVIDGLGKAYGSCLGLQQTPAESTPYRFARLDLKHFSPRSGRFVKGDIARGEVYYTNSTHLAVSADVSPIDRVTVEGTFHPFIEGETISPLWLGDARPSKESLADFIIRVFRETENQQIVFAPEFTTCLACNRTTRGLADRCGHCQSDDVAGITMITGYYSRISDWNKGKVAELRDRKRMDRFG